MGGSSLPEDLGCVALSSVEPCQLMGGNFPRGSPWSPLSFIVTRDSSSEDGFHSEVPVQLGNECLVAIIWTGLLGNPVLLDLHLVELVLLLDPIR